MFPRNYFIKLIYLSVSNYLSPFVAYSARLLKKKKIEH
jgi:hypothetical protein